MDRTPTEVYAALLDEGVYHCSIRTMYRILCQGQSNNPHCGEVKFPTLALFLLVLDAPFLLAAKVAH
jgi:putative transposase